MSKKKHDLSFDEFDKQSKNQWEKLAEHALKGKSIESLIWKVDDHIHLDPIYTNNENIQPFDILSNRKKNNDWWIGEDFTNFDPVQVNLLLLNALQNGLDSPCIYQPSEISTLFQDIRLDYIQPFFKDFSQTFLGLYYDYIQSLNFSKNTLKGGIIIVDQNHGGDISTEQVKAIKNISVNLPLYYFAEIDLSFDQKEIGLSIASRIKDLINLIIQLRANELNPRIICQVEIDNDYLKSIAIVRALKILLVKIIDKYKLEKESLLLDISVNQSALESQLAIVGATAKTLAAVCGGADRITINCEALNIQEDEVVMRRMSRNIHHVMKMESGLHLLADPLKGSYSIERLTSSILSEIHSHVQLGEENIAT